MTSTRSSPTSSVAATNAPAWAGPAGLPTPHVVRAALHVAALLDQRGSLVADARETYWHRATGGAFGPPDLRLGERLLIDCGLVVERDSTLYPLADLSAMLDGTVEDAVATLSARALTASLEASPLNMEHAEALAELVPDPARREELLAALGRRFDDSYRRLLGEIGEEHVVTALRRELEGLGYSELARAVRHLSLETDQAGYDISAPRVVGPARLIEVKATTSNDEGTHTVHLSRNEAETGARYADWSLVVCRISDVDARVGEILGWCPAARLRGLLPHDVASGRWENAVIDVPAELLVPGLPGAAA
jgi:Protein NO VEIN, C-terminal